MLSLVLLFLASALASNEPVDLTFKWNNNWMNTDNWDGGLPGPSSAVTFPDQISNFGPNGGVVLLAPKDSSTSATVDLSKITFQTNMKLQFEDNVKITFHDTASPTQKNFKAKEDYKLDFMCAANWVGSDYNLPPCYQDTAIFPQGSTFMVAIGPDAFVIHLEFNGKDVYSDDEFAQAVDRYQFEGSTKFLTAKCGESPISKGNVKNCAALCINTCPQLITNTNAKDTQLLDQTKTIINQTTQALSDAQDYLSSSTASGKFTGSLLFNTNRDSSFAGILDTVAALTPSLVSSAGAKFFSNISFPEGSCAATAQGDILCTGVVFYLTAAKATAFSITTAMTSFPTIADLYLPVVEAQLQIELDKILLNAAKEVGPVSFRITAPARFVNQGMLNSSLLAVNQLKAAVAARLGSPSQIGDIYSVTMDMKDASNYYLTFLHAPRALLGAPADLAAAITGSSPAVFSFDHDANPATAAILLYQSGEVAAAANPTGFFSLVFQSSVLYKKLPMTTANRLKYRQVLFSFILAHKTTFAPADLADAAFNFVSTGARRATAANQVEISITGSLQVQTLVPADFAGLTFDDEAATAVGSETVGSGAETSFNAALQETAIVDSTAALNSANTDANTLSNSLSTMGIATGNTGKGSYSFSDLDFSDDANGNKPYAYLMIAPAKILVSMSKANASFFASNLAAELSKFLPITSSQITVSGQLGYLPVDATKVKDIDNALYSLKVDIVAPAFMFNKNGPYMVALPVDASGMKTSEADSGLSKVAVKVALEKTLWLLTLEAQIAKSQSDLSTLQQGSTSENSSASSGSSLPIIAAAAGGAILLIIIIVILVLRNNRNRSRGGKSSNPNAHRAVVAFENPMYDDPSKKMGATNEPFYDNGNVEKGNRMNNGSEGLYDEPAMNSEGRLSKANPVYQSTEDIVGFGDDMYEEADHTAGTGYLDVSPDKD